MVGAQDTVLRGARASRRKSTEERQGGALKPKSSTKHML